MFGRNVDTVSDLDLLGIFATISIVPHFVKLLEQSNSFYILSSIKYFYTIKNLHACLPKRELHAG
jgi:hypothetical protein